MYTPFTHLNPTNNQISESIHQKSIIAQLPQSIDYIQKFHQQQFQIENLKQELNYYKNQQVQPSNDELQYISKNMVNDDFKRLIAKAADVQSIRDENQELKAAVRNLSEELRKQKTKGMKSSTEISRQFQSSLRQLQFLKQQNLNKNQQSRRTMFQNQQLKNHNLKNQKLISIYMKKLNQTQQRSNKPQYSYNRDKEILQIKIRELESIINVKDTEYRMLQSQKRNSDHLKVDHGGSRNLTNSHFEQSKFSRTSQLDAIDIQRYNLKLSEKNKQYEQMYSKYLRLENQHAALEENYNQIDRQRKFLAQRLSDLQIHTEGDEVVGELQNKLVLMSTEVMRLGHLGRNKTSENKELNIRVKELLFKKQSLQQELIQKDKIILNYKEELRMLEGRLESKQELSYDYSSREDQQKIILLTNQVQRISNLYKEKAEQMKSIGIQKMLLQEKCTRLEVQYKDLQRENKDALENSHKTRQTNTVILNLEAQRDHYIKNNHNLKQQIQILQEKIMHIKSDKQRIHSENDNLFYQLKSKQSRTTFYQEEIKKLQLRFQQKEAQFRQKIHHYEENIIEKNNEIKKIEEKLKIVGYQAQQTSRIRNQLPKYEEILKDMQRLQSSQMSLKIELSKYEEKLALLAQENERLTFIIQKQNSQTSEIDNLKRQLEIKQKRIRQVQREIESITMKERRYREQIQEYQQKFRTSVVNSQQIDSVEFNNRRLKDQIQSLNLKITLKEEEYEALKSRMNKKVEDQQKQNFMVDELKSKIISLQSYSNSYEDKNLSFGQSKKYQKMLKEKDIQIKEIKQRYSESEEIYNTFSAQIQRLNIVLGQKMSDLVTKQKEVDLLKHKVKICEQALQERTSKKTSSQKSIQSQKNLKLELYQNENKEHKSQITMLKEQYNHSKNTTERLQEQLSNLSNQKINVERHISDLQFELSSRTNNFKTIQDSFRLTIMEIKNSNQRLQKSVSQIQNHYIQKYQRKQRECQELKNENRNYGSQIYELQKKLSFVQVELGSQIKEKNKYIVNLTNDKNYSKEQIQAINKIKGQYEIKMALLSQQLERLTSIKAKYEVEINSLMASNREMQINCNRSLRDSSANVNTIDALSEEIQRLNHILAENLEKIKRYEKNIRIYEATGENIRQELASQQQSQTQKIRNFQNMCQNYELKIEELLTYQRQFQSSKTAKIQSLIAENQNLIGQIEHFNKNMVNTDSYDEKIKIIGNYEGTIRHLKQQNNFICGERDRILEDRDRIKLERDRFKDQCDRILEERDRVKEESHKLNQISHEIQERGRILEASNRNLAEKYDLLEEKHRFVEHTFNAIKLQKKRLEQKAFTASEQINRLQQLLMLKEKELKEFNNKLERIPSSDRIQNKKGIFVINQANEIDERSRSASGNNMVIQQQLPKNINSSDLSHKYVLLESVNKKLTHECQCLRNKCIEYQFKMNQLRQEFSVLNRLVQEYKQENQKLKETNRRLSLKSSQTSTNYQQIRSHFSPQHSSVKGQYFVSNKRGEQSQKNNGLLNQIDRLNKVNSTLQSEVHQLRLNTTDGIALRKRYEQNVAMMMLLFVEIESLRSRLKAFDRESLSPRKHML